MNTGTDLQHIVDTVRQQSSGKKSLRIRATTLDGRSVNVAIHFIFGGIALLTDRDCHRIVVAGVNDLEQEIIKFFDEGVSGAEIV